MSLLTSLKPLLLRSRLFMTDDQIKEVIQSGKKGGRRRGGVNLKIGQGGTLDPKAEGVLVVGVGNGTRKLTDFLECDKVGDGHVVALHSYDVAGIRSYGITWFIDDDVRFGRFNPRSSTMGARQRRYYPECPAKVYRRNSSDASCVSCSPSRFTLFKP